MSICLLANEAQASKLELYDCSLKEVGLVESDDYYYAFPPSEDSLCLQGNISLPDGGKHFLKIRYGLIDFGELVLKDEQGNIDIKRFGDKYLFSDRTYENPFFVIPIDYIGSATFNLKLYRPLNAFTVPISLLTEKEHAATSVKDAWFSGIIIGAYIVYIFLLLMTYLSFRFRFIIIYTIYVVLALLFYLHEMGIGYMSLWRDSIFIQDMLDGTAALAIIFFTLFFIEFFKSSGISKWIQMFLYSVLAINVLIFILEFIYAVGINFPGKLFIGTSYLAMFINGLLILIINYFAIKNIKGSIFKEENWFALAIFTFTILAVSLLGFLTGIFYYSKMFFERLLPILLLLEMAFFLSAFFIRHLIAKEDNARLKINLARTNQKATENLLLGEEKERKRIARDVHDGLGGSLAAVKLFIESLGLKIEAVRNEKNYNKSIEYIDKAVLEMRKIIRELSPSAVNVGDLSENVRSLCNEFQANFNIIIEHHIEELETDADKGNHIYKIVSELLTNAVKHSQASIVNFEIISGIETIKIRYSDNGIGIKNIDRITEGFGLNNIKKRIELLHGSMHYKNNSDKGVTILLDMPI